MIQNAKITSKGRTPASYHEQAAKRGSAEFIMSSSSLRAFAECPQKWFNGFEFPDSKATEWGRLLDVCLLTPDEFLKLYSIKPSTYRDAKTGEEKPWNANSNVCKAWKDAQEGKECVSDAKLEEVRQAIARLRADEIIAAWCAACDTQVLVEAEWHDEPTGLVIPIRCLIDFVPRNDTEFAKCVGDLKTTCNAKPQAWQRWAFTAGYHVQGAFNLDLLAAATGEDRNTFCFILSESSAPWQTGKRMLSEDFKELGRAEYKRHLRNYAACVKSGRWPGYDDNDEAAQGWTVVSPEPWMENAVMFAPKYEFGDAVETEAAPEDDGRFDISN